MNNKTYTLAVSDINEVSTDFSDEFAIARINVLSTKPNSHKINITDEVLRRSGETLRGKWVIAEYDKFRNDVTTHTKNTHIIGIVPQDAKIDYIVDENGDTTMVTEAVISKLYATEIYNLFKDKNFRNVSVEMGVENERPSDLGDGSTNIDAINYYAICVLSQRTNGSCPNANMEIIKFSSDEATEYYDKISTKTKALELSQQLKDFAESLESLDSKDKIDERTSLMEENVLQTEQFAEDNKDDEKDVVMSEGEQPKDEPKSEESKEMAEPKEEPKTEDEKEMSEEEPTQMAEEPKEGEDDKKEDEPKEDKEMSCDGEKEMGCGEEKTFSLEQFASEDSLKELSDEMAELVKMESADEVIKKFAEKMDEIKQLSEKVAELEEFQTKTFEAEREAKVNGILAEVKNDLEPKQFAELLEESKEVTLDGLTAFSNRVKAFAYEYSKTRTDEAKEDDGVMLMASTEDVSVNSGDVFERLSKKYK